MQPNTLNPSDSTKGHPDDIKRQYKEKKPILRTLEHHFESFRRNIIGGAQKVDTYKGKTTMIYADWTASGRMYWPIEETLLYKVHPWVANTHTEASLCGDTMTRAYAEAKQQIKAHVNANGDDVLIPCGTGMTGALAKLQRLMGLVVPEHHGERPKLDPDKRPVVFISQMEHHSNHTSWLETICDVVLIPQTNEGEMDLRSLGRYLGEFEGRPLIVSITACSNVTGVETPYHTIAGMAHAHGGLCFVDFAASAPYVDIDMHPSENHALDAITFSPHKFLGGPGSSGILIFNKKLYHKKVPDIPGGGTVTFTDPWGNHSYKQDIEEREDGGTPGFLQTIRAAMAIKLKEVMGTANMRLREQEINQRVFAYLDKIEGLRILASGHRYRLSIFSFTIKGLHYDLVTRMLSDRFGIQARGGCSCAGTYGHYLMDIDPSASEKIQKKSRLGCSLDRPGWVRISFHPTQTDKEVAQVCHAIRLIAQKGHGWAKGYKKTKDGHLPKNPADQVKIPIKDWFESPFLPDLKVNIT